MTPKQIAFIEEKVEAGRKNCRGCGCPSCGCGVDVKASLLWRFKGFTDIRRFNDVSYGAASEGTFLLVIMGCHCGAIQFFDPVALGIVDKDGNMMGGGD
ncbi:MAG: hypothetical protein PHX83_06580 [Acidobacteriia bacterium]|nr:hypothetical protein [Terriglobia bacterium]